MISIIFLSSRQPNEFYRRRANERSKGSVLWFVRIRLIDLPMYLTFKAILNIHPSLECGQNPITREGHKERVLFNRFNWNYFSPPSFPGREGGTRGSLGIFCNNRSFLFFLSFSLIGEKSSFTLFHSSFLSAGLNGRGFIMGY